MRMKRTGGAWAIGGLGLSLALMLPDTAARAALDPADLCDRAVMRASSATGVPLEVLRTIALVESGRNSNGVQRPWPWTANYGGQGAWYANRAEAELAVEERISMGATNIDIGCFQINQHWHGEAFSGISEMFDPDANALYAARFLAKLFDETGTWLDAAAAYHSRTPEHSEAYRARFEAVAEGAEGAAPPDPRINRFPLLQGGTGGALGSLVPQVEGMGSLFGAAP